MAFFTIQTVGVVLQDSLKTERLPHQVLTSAFLAGDSALLFRFFSLPCCYQFARKRAVVDRWRWSSTWSLPNPIPELLSFFQRATWPNMNKRTSSSMGKIRSCHHSWQSFVSGSTTVMKRLSWPSRWVGFIEVAQYLQSQHLHIASCLCANQIYLLRVNSCCVLT